MVRIDCATNGQKKAFCSCLNGEEDNFCPLPFRPAFLLDRVFPFPYLLSNKSNENRLGLLPLNFIQDSFWT
jgi:hypothetical protein